MCLWRYFWKRLACKLSKVDGSLQCGWASSNPLEVELEQRGREKLNSLCMTTWAETSIFSPCSWFSCLQTWTRIYTFGSTALGPWNYATCFPGSAAYRQQMLGLLSLHNHISQYFIIFFLPLFIYISFFSLSLYIYLSLSLKIYQWYAQFYI